MKFNPTFGTAIKAGDTLIALGEISKQRRLLKITMAEGCLS